MERLDKLLANTGRWSRREVKELVRRGQVRVDGVIAASAEQKITPAAAVTVSGEPVALGRCTYLLLHKPAGVLTATEDRRQPTVLNLLPAEYRRIGIAPVDAFASGITLSDGTECLPAGLELLPENRCIVTLRQGKFHQVKRMLASRGAPVITLHRLSMGTLSLPEDLLPGRWRPLTAEETAALRQSCGL